MPSSSPGKQLISCSFPESRHRVNGLRSKTRGPIATGSVVRVIRCGSVRNTRARTPGILGLQARSSLTRPAVAPPWVPRLARHAKTSRRPDLSRLCEGEPGMKEWRHWHNAYDDPQSSLFRRLDVVRARLARALDMAENPVLRLLSLCAGEGRDVIPVLYPEGGPGTSSLCSSRAIPSWPSGDRPLREGRGSNISRSAAPMPQVWRFSPMRFRLTSSCCAESSGTSTLTMCGAS
jgi:hypothetical protein